MGRDQVSKLTGTTPKILVAILTKLYTNEVLMSGADVFHLLRSTLYFVLREVVPLYKSHIIYIHTHNLTA